MNMQTYKCPVCQEEFTALFDLSTHLPFHARTGSQADMPVYAAPRAAKSINESYNLLTPPTGTCVRSLESLQLLRVFYKKFRSIFVVDLGYDHFPEECHIDWMRKTGKTAGVFQWSTTVDFHDRKNWTYNADSEINYRIRIAPGADWSQTLNTLAHEMVHLLDNIERGFKSRSWTEAHTGLWLEITDEFNEYCDSVNYQYYIAQMRMEREEAENGRDVRERIQVGDRVQISWDSLELTATVSRRNKRMVSIKNIEWSEKDKKRWGRITEWKVPYYTITLP